MTSILKFPLNLIGKEKQIFFGIPYLPESHIPIEKLFQLQKYQLYIKSEMALETENVEGP